MSTPDTITRYTFTTGKRRTLKGVSLLMEHLWQVEAVVVHGSTALFYTPTYLFRGVWPDQTSLREWLLSRRSLSGTPLTWDGEQFVLGKKFPIDKS